MSIRYCLVSQPNNKLISNSEQLHNSTNVLPIEFGIILSPNLRNKNLANYQINPRTTDDNKNSKICPIEILLDSGANGSIVRKDILHERRKILKQKRNKWSTMAKTFNTALLTELKLKLPELNHTVEICAKRHWIF